MKETLNATCMFPGKIPDSFSMSSSKVSDLISEATDLYLYELLADAIQGSHLSLHHTI